MAIWKLDVKSAIVTTRVLHQTSVTQLQANADAKRVSQDCDVMCVRKATSTSLTSVSTQQTKAYGFMIIHGMQLLTPAYVREVILSHLCVCSVGGGGIPWPLVPSLFWGIPPSPVTGPASVGGGGRVTPLLARIG